VLQHTCTAFFKIRVKCLFEIFLYLSYANKMPVVGLLTDFSNHGWYVASLKATIAGILPEASIVDISHTIAPGDVGAGAFVLSQCWHDFPDGSVFCCVVDPGVGTTRQPIAIQEVESGKFFVGPDNGLASYVIRLGNASKHYERVSGYQTRRIVNPVFFKEQPSHTFHGRDLFAPAAARLAGGWDFEKIGPTHTRLHATRWPEIQVDGDLIKLRVLYVDNFGTLITNLRSCQLRELGGPDTPKKLIYYGDKRTHALPVVNTFADVPEHHLLAFIGSGGLLELAVNGGSASKVLGVKAGDWLSISLDTA
jgi:S-adenosylmethionine hydrolase